MMTLVEFLRDRIAEDEAAAEAAGGAHWDHLPTLTGPDPGVIMHRVFDDDGMFAADCNDHRESEHIARHDPFRVLAECEAKRRIVEMLDDEVIGWDELDVGYSPEDWLSKQIARTMALPHADHPDYDESWRL